MGYLHDIFTVNKRDHAGELRVSFKDRLIKVNWIKIAQQMVYKAEKHESNPPKNNNSQIECAKN